MEKETLVISPEVISELFSGEHSEGMGKLIQKINNSQEGSITELISLINDIIDSVENV